MQARGQLVDLPRGATAVVAAVRADPELCRRLEAMGLRPGQPVQMLHRGWWSGPLHVRVGMTELMLRRRTARCVELAS